jgi:hypothetical protein
VQTVLDSGVALSPCSDAFRFCPSNGLVFPLQPVAAGTGCWGGGIIAASDPHCSACSKGELVPVLAASSGGAASGQAEGGGPVLSPNSNDSTGSPPAAGTSIVVIGAAVAAAVVVLAAVALAAVLLAPRAASAVVPAPVPVPSPSTLACGPGLIDLTLAAEDSVAPPVANVTFHA